MSKVQPTGECASAHATISRRVCAGAFQAIETLVRHPRRPGEALSSIPSSARLSDSFFSNNGPRRDISVIVQRCARTM